MTQVTPLPWWTAFNPRAKYFVSVLDRSGGVAYSGVATSIQHISEIIAPTFQMLGYPAATAPLIRQMRVGHTYRHKNGFALTDVLKIQDLNPNKKRIVNNYGNSLIITQPETVVT